MDDLATTLFGAGTAATSITGTNNTFTIGNVQLALPKVGVNSFSPPIALLNTSFSTATNGWDTDPNANPAYDSLAALWDAYNGADGLARSGIPTSWGTTSATLYWGADSSGSQHAQIDMGAGALDYFNNTTLQYVALQVL